LILEFSQLPKVESHHIKRIVDQNILNRTYDSVKSRYNDFLIKLGAEDIERIISFTEKYGIEGYLNFAKG
jgi:hypothetical protein